VGKILIKSMVSLLIPPLEKPEVGAFKQGARGDFIIKTIDYF